jgi:hypothetical protein
MPFVLVACAARANVGDLGSTDAAVPSSSSSPSPSPKDGGDEREASKTDCRLDLPEAAEFIDAVIVTGSPPFLEGGSIAPGLYELTAMRIYFTGAEAGTMRIRETLRVRGSTKAGALESFAEGKDATGSFTAFEPRARTMTFETGAGPAIFMTLECPQKDYVRSNRFEATSDTLTLFESVTQTERVYRRVQ